MRKKTIIPILALVCLAIATIPAAAVQAADPGPAGGQTLAMMGGGGMMGGQGYGGPGGMRGNGYYGGRGGMRGGGYGWNGFSGENGFRGYGNSYRNDQRRALTEELHRDRRELSDMIHSKNADPDKIDRKMEQIERLESQIDDMR